MFKSQGIAHKNQLPDSLENEQSGRLVTQDFHFCLAWTTWSCRAAEWAPVPCDPHSLGGQCWCSLPAHLSLPCGHLSIATPLGLPHLQPALKASGHCQALQFSVSSQKSNHRAQILRGTARLALRAHLVTRHTYLSIFLCVLAQRKI